jgi:hypothetical protein
MQVIEAQSFLVLVPHDHLHIKHQSAAQKPVSGIAAAG